MIDDHAATTLIELTERVRSCALAMHVASFPDRLRDVLAELLKDFIVMTPVGIWTAYAYVGPEATLPPMEDDVLQEDDFFMFVWAGTYAAMVCRCQEVEEGGCTKDTRAALEAVADRTSVFAYERWREDKDPDALVIRLDQIAFAFSIGATLGCTRPSNSAPTDIQRLLRVVALLEPADRALLEQRYRDGQQQAEICGVHGHERGDASQHFADVLERARAISLEQRDEDPRAPQPS